MAAEIINSVMAIAGGLGGGSKNIEPIPPDAFVPYRVHTDERASEIDSGFKALDRMRGL